MKEHLLKSFFYHPAKTDIVLEDGMDFPVYNAQVLEIEDTGLANLAVWDNEGNHSFHQGVPMKTESDDGSFATWSPQA